MPEMTPAALTVNNFVFLSHDTADGDDARKQVRSRAAQHSHRVGPRKPKESKKKKRSECSRQSSSPKKRTPNIDQIPARRSSTTNKTPSSRRSSSANDCCSQLSATAVPHPSHTSVEGYADDTFDVYPVPRQAWFPKIMHSMQDFMLRGWSALHTTASDRQEALVWVQRLTMSEPTYFLMNLLSVAGDFVQRGQMDPGIVLWLNSQVVAALNTALCKPEKALNAATVLTVGRIALREIVLGDYETGKTVHRPAFARMIKMAGGLKRLGLPSLVRLHLAWAERLMKKKTGVSIVELESSLSSEETFNDANAGKNADKEVLDKYLPMRPSKPDGL